MRPGPVSGAWREGDPVGHRQFVPGGRRPARARRGAAAGAGGLRDVGHAQRAGDNAVLVEHALTGDSHVVGDAGPGAPVAGLVGRADRPGRARSTPTGCSSSRSNVLGGCQGTHRALVARARRAARGGAGSPSSRSATRSPPRPPWPPRSGSPRWAARPRRVDGRDAGPGVGRRRTRTGSSAPWCSPSTAYATADQVAWCQPQLLAIRSDPAFRGGDYYDARRLAGRPAWGSPGGSRT